MSKLPIYSLFKIIFEGNISLKFLLATILSFAFAMSVILSTLGLMDGFENSLKSALAKSNGDLKFSAISGFFIDDDKLKDQLENHSIKSYTSILQIEAFALSENESKGVLLKGIEKKDFLETTNLDLSNLDLGVYIGSEYAKKYDLSLGDKVSIAIASNKAKDTGSAILRQFTIDGIINHGIYEKDLRFIYVKKNILEDILSYKSGVSNLGLIKLIENTDLEKIRKNLNRELSEDFSFESFWNESSVLINAVEIEKLSISIVLQLIVVIAILNIVAFIIFISEKKTQDFFMLRTLGLSLKKLQYFWFFLLTSIWAVSCLFAYFFVEFFNSYILTLPFLKIPGDIYVLSELEIVLDKFDYLFVYGVSLVWILLIGLISMNRMRKKPLIAGLRQEFA